MKLYSNNRSDSGRRYPPTLLERLQDDEPKSSHDSYQPANMKQIRSIVQKNIIDIINNANIEDRLNEHRHKHVIDSVLNYGVSALIGSHENRQNWNILEKKIRKSILFFEPRIIPETLLIRSLQQYDSLSRYAIIMIEIRGLIYWDPRPIDICMNGRYDFESEKVELVIL